MRIPISIDNSGIAGGLRQTESLIDGAMNRIQSRINAVHGPNLSGRSMGGSMSVMSRQGNQLVGTLTGMGALTTGLGIGAAVGGVALLEQGLSRAIKKAREFQTATLAIAATLGSIGTWQGANGRPLSQGQQAQRSMWQAEKYRATILERSAKNILSFDEQLQAFQSGLAPGARKGLNPNQILKLTEQSAIVAKTLGLRGEQIANASRLLMGGGVNVGRSTIGRALGIQNTDISTRSGAELQTFLQNKMRGFDQMQSKFEGSIEGMVSTLEAKIDVLSARAGEKFMRGIAPTLKQIGMLSEPTRDQFKSEKEYKTAVTEYTKQSKSMNTLVDAAAQGFNGLFNGVKAVVESESFKTLLDLLVKIAGVSKQIMLAVIFTKIAGAVGAATGALSKFLGLMGASSLTGGVRGLATGAMPIDIAMSTLNGSSGGRGMRGGVISKSGWSGFGSTKASPIPLDAGASPFIGQGYGANRKAMASGAARQGMATTAVSGNSGRNRTPNARQQYQKWQADLNRYGVETQELQARLPFLQGDEKLAAQARLAELNNLSMATSTMMGTTPFKALPLKERVLSRGRDFMQTAQQRLPVGMIGMMGGQMVKEMGWGTTGDILGSTIQGGSAGYMVNGLLQKGMIGTRGISGKFSGWANKNAAKLGMGGGLAAGLGAGISTAASNASMQDLGSQTTTGQYAGMAGGGALKWGGSALMMTGNPLIAGGAALAGGILEPLISEMQKAAEQAKESASALAEMREKFPQAAKAADVKGQIHEIDAQIAAVNSGKSNLSRKVLPSLLAKRKNLKKQYDDATAEGTFVGEDTKLADTIEKLKGQIDLYSKYGGKGPTVSRKLISLQTELAKSEVLKNKSSIPVNFDEAAFGEKMKDESNPNYAKWQESYRKWSAPGTGHEKDDYAVYVSDLATKKKEAMQTAAMPEILKQIDTQGAIQRMGISFGQKSLAAEGSGRKSLANYIDFKSGLYEKAGMFDKGLSDPGFKSFLAGSLKERKTDMRDTYESGVLGLQSNNLERRKLSLEGIRLKEDTPIKMSKLKIEAQEIALAGEQTNLDSARLELKGEALKDARSSIWDSIRRGNQTRTRMGQDFSLNRQDAQLGFQQAQMGQRSAEIASPLFYGGMGPVSDVASSIRYNVESEYAQKFDAGEYESAYREKLGLEEQQLEVNKQLADVNTKRAALGLDRIEEDYANALTDLTLQMRGNTRALGENSLDQASLGLEQQSIGLKSSSISLSAVENAYNQERLAQDTTLTEAENKLKGKNLDITDARSRRELGDLGKTLKSVGAGKGLTGMPETQEDWQRVKQLMDNGMSMAQAKSAIKGYPGTNATASTNTSGGDTFNISATVNEAPKLDPATLQRDFERWLKDYCRTQKLKAGG